MTMNTQQRFWPKTVASVTVCGLFFGPTIQSARAASTDISDVPMVVKSTVKPNVAVIFDNSQSMDAFMGGALVSGSDPKTRSNIGRKVMRETITAYRSSFNWGLMTYGMTGAPTFFKTWAYYLGSNVSMTFTDDCVGYVAAVPAGYPPTPGVSASNGNRRCLVNPQPFAPGGAFVTYGKSGDDPDIQDVLYDNGAYTTAWALSSGPGTGYQFYSDHLPASGNSWAVPAFTGDPFGCGNCTLNFTPTDAGYLPSNPPITRQLYLPRAQGYLSAITGVGNINVPVQADSTPQFNSLIANLAAETNGPTTEIKNGALFTPLTGTLGSAKTYFSSAFQGNSSPIAYTCQKNFVMLVTDGLPTGDTGGNLYSAVDRTNTFNAGPGTWTFGTAAQDAINATTALRTTPGPLATTYDIKTYVVALGDTVANANAVAVMNAMAAAGGTSTAYLANNAATFKSAIDTVAAGILATTAAASAVAVANANVIAGDNASYASSYNSGTWSGDLLAYPINLTTGIPDIANPIWIAGSAQTQLNALAPGTRKIATYSGITGTGQGIQFRPTTAGTATKLSAAQQALLDTPVSPPGPGDGAAVLAYLRGDRSGEGGGAYRVRTNVLGDIIDSEPVVVREPSANYADPGYAAFKTANATRTRVVFQGANDGMLHGFNTATGAEEWAYVPNLLMANLNNLTLRNGFSHKFLVDGTPVTNDVDFSNTDGIPGSPAPDWHTILAGGFGKGGRGYYALDVTATVAANEAAVADKVLWEFPNSAISAAVKANIGYSFGRPIIVKTRARGWVVLVASGFNNGTNAGDSGGDGQGYLYVLNARTGELIQTMSTGVGTVTEPSGFAHISGYVEAGDIDNTVEYVYGGDLKGNVWRFDLTAASIGSWNVKKLATLVDASGTVQSVTTEPELGKVNIAGGVFKRFVYVGTGLYLGDKDIPGSVGANASATQTQTMYGLIDDLTSTPVILPLRSQLQIQTMTTVGTTRTATNNAVNFLTKQGWYLDLPVSGERANTHPSLALGALVFTTNIPNSDPCLPGGSSFFNVLDYKTGGFLTGSTALWSSLSLGNALASRVVLIKLPSGDVMGLARKSDATTLSVKVPLPATGTSIKRHSWKELML